MSRAPRDIGELMELDLENWRDLADTLEADGRAEGDPTKVEEARIVRRHKHLWDKPKPTASSSSSKPATKARTARTKPKGKSRRRSMPATRRALGAATPDRQLAGAIRSTASIGWTIAGGIVAMVLVYLLVTKGARSVAAVRELETIAKQVVYPAKAFPEKNGGWIAAAPGAKGQPQQRQERPPGTSSPTDPGGETIIGIP